MTFNSYSHMAQELGCDRASVVRWIVREVGKGRASVVEKSTGITHLFLTNYNDSQQVKRYTPSKKSPVSRAIKHISNKANKEKVDSAIASSDKSVNSTKPKYRSKAQKWNDGQIDLISKKFKDIWSCEPNIKDVTIWLKLADKSVGLVIVGLSSAKICEHETGKPTNNMTGYLRWFFRNRSDRDIDMATKIDRGYEINFKTKVGAVSIGDIMKREVLK